MTGTKISEQTIGFDHEARIGVLETRVDDTRITISEKIAAEKEATALALASTLKATDVALQTAERAAAKAELAADKHYLESQIVAIKESFKDQIISVRETLQALILSLDKAIQKAEAAAEKRFECVAVDTLILCADLIWRPAGELCPGDELIGFDEEALSRRGRRYQRAVVLENSIADDRLFLVKTESGSVRCNAVHPWLTRSVPSGNWRWIKTQDLRPGYQLMRALSPWEVDDSWEAGWLAGICDGEGCLTLDIRKRSQLTISQRESATSTNIKNALAARVNVNSYRYEPGLHRRSQPMFHFVITRLPDILTILGSVRPPRLMATADKAWDRKPLGSWQRSVSVISIESVGAGAIAQLSTTTKTYIANGFAMHNSVNEFRATLSDQQRDLATKAEVNLRFTALDDRVNGMTELMREMRENMREMAGRNQGYSAGWGYLVGGIGAVVAVITLVVLLAKTS